MCARVCLVDRLGGPAGVCQSGRYARVASYFPHFGEGPPLTGRHGSGTIFFGGCNLQCVFCQNWEVSQGGEGVVVSDEELAAIMLELQSAGCHNVNLVSPSHGGSSPGDGHVCFKRPVARGLVPRGVTPWRPL